MKAARSGSTGRRTVLRRPGSIATLPAAVERAAPPARPVDDVCERLHRAGITVVEADTAGGERGWYDAEAHEVIIRAGLPCPARRSTLAHELFHAEAGDTVTPTWWGRRNEQLVETYTDELAARHLLPLPSLVDVLLWAETLDVVADALAVDTDTVLARLDTLTPAERRYVDRRTATVRRAQPEGLGLDDD